MTSPASSVPRLEKLLGAGQVLTDPAELASYAVDGCIPSAVVQPADAAAVAEVVRFAAAEKLALIPCGARTKLSIGMPPSRYDLAVDLRRLKSVAHYDPGDLTLSVDAGMPLAEIEPLLAAHGQFLPLAVPFWARTTAGGTIASGVDSPLRQFYGSPRDFLLGMEFVSGSGARTKSGGRVVKNVTGYDLHKLLAGSLGTLGIITRIHFKTFPLLPERRGFLAAFSELATALDFRRRIAASPLSPSTLDLLSPEAASLFVPHSPGDWFSSGRWMLLAGYGGEPVVLARYERDLARLAQESAAIGTAVLDDAARSLVWDRLREAVPLFLEASPAATILKVTLLPAQLREALDLLLATARDGALPAAVLARAMGIVYFALLPNSAGGDTLEKLARFCDSAFTLAQALGGHVSIPWCPLELKRRVNVWGPSRGDFALLQRVKNVFDPAGIFSPGRFVGAL